MRIDEENLKLAKRIVSQKPVLSLKDMESDYQKFNRTRAFLMKDRSLEIGSIVKSQRDRFSKIEAHSILFPDIKKPMQNADEEAKEVDQYAAMGKAI